MTLNLSGVTSSFFANSFNSDRWNSFNPQGGQKVMGTAQIGTQGTTGALLSIDLEDLLCPISWLYNLRAPHTT